MKAYRTLILSKKDVEGLVGIKDALRAVEVSFREYGLGKTQMPPKTYITLSKYNGDFRAMPGYIDKTDKCNIKWVNVHPDNPKKGLPAVMAINILSDPRNGYPLCIMDSTYCTALRTGAAGGVAAKYLARPDSRVVGIVGCGVQAQTQLEAVLQNFKIREAWLSDPSVEHKKIFMKKLAQYNLKFVSSCTLKECVGASDILITTTPSRKPIIKLNWLKEGVHVNAIGADAKGKEELEAVVLKKGKVIIDSWEQASHSGEINVPVRKKIISKKDIYADIGQVVSGKKKGRTSKKEITVFDSTGLAVQDVAVADIIYRKALKAKKGKWVKIV